MKNNLFTLILIGLIALNNNGFAQQAAASNSSMPVSASAKPTLAATKSAPSKSTTRKPKTVAAVIAQPKRKQVGLEQQLATFIFVINRGEVFAVNAPGELTEVSLSGFTTDALPINSKGLMNETDCRNKVTLTGAVNINDYSPEPATGVTASLCLRPLTATRGLTLGLNVDGQPLHVLLPFDSGDCRWRAGYTYRYVVTVSSGALQVTGMTVTRTPQREE